MNKRLILFTIIVCLFIVIICTLTWFLYYSWIYSPDKQTRITAVSKTQAASVLTQTQAAINQSQTQAAINLTQTQAAIYQSQTQAAVNLTQTQESIDLAKTQAVISQNQTQESIVLKHTQVAIAQAQTQTAVPTLTPTVPPQPVICNAVVMGTNRRMYSLPIQGHQTISQIIEEGTRIRILGRIEGQGWFQVDVNGEKGWMQSNVLSITGPNSCEPTSYNLHYLLNLLKPDEQLVLEDTFSSSANTWKNKAGEIVLGSTNYNGNTHLDILADGEEIISTNNPRLNNLSAFKLYTAFIMIGVKENGSIGIRFRDNGQDYYLLELSLNDCRVSVYATDQKIYENNNVLRFCPNVTYDMILSLSKDNKMELQINGFDPILVNLQDPDGRYVQGNIKLVVKDAHPQFDYVVITAPK